MPFVKIFSLNYKIKKTILPEVCIVVEPISEDNSLKGQNQKIN